MNQELTLQIILENPPEGVDFGIQKGSGSKYETIRKQRSVSGNLEFEFTISLKNSKDAIPDFLGPVVQGRAGERFIYIDIGTYAGQADSIWNRRLKVPLKNISFSMVAQLLADASLSLETNVAGTGRDMGPNCGTVKPFGGWYVKKSLPG